MRHLEVHLNFKGSDERRLVLHCVFHYIKPMDTNSLRQAMRQQRRQLTIVERTVLSQQLTFQLLQQSFVHASQAIACYWPFDGEVDTQSIISILQSLDKTCYLPVLDAKTKLLHFAEYAVDTPLQTNRYGIAEPIQSKIGVSILCLDLILLPMVAFDAQGHRLGTGGGYYDRTLHSLGSCPRPTKPLLVGLAYEFQRITYLQPQPWDITLDGIITDQQLYSTTLGNQTCIIG